MRRRPRYSAMLLSLSLSMLCGSAYSSDTGSTSLPDVLVLPETIRFDDMGRGLAAQPTAVGSRPVLVREERGVLRARPLSTGSVDVQGALQARLSSAGMVAVLRPGRGAKQRDLAYPPNELSVFDSLGSERWRANGIVNFSWSPDGRRLLFVAGSDRAERLPLVDSCGVWDSRTSRTNILSRACRDVGWLAPDTALIAEPPGGVVAIAIGSGSRALTAFKGVDVSADRRYALSVNEEGTISVLRNASDDDDWAKIVGLLGEFRTSASMRPFWVKDAGSVLCVTAIRSPARTPVTGASLWKVFLIDVARNSLVREIPGKGIRPAPDSTTLLIVQGGVLKFVRL